jgi:polysaccharide biosynthesis protein PelD
MRFFAQLQRMVRAGTLVPEQISNRAQWLEIVLIPLLAIAWGWLAAPKDPMLSQSQFPWFWFVPVLIALRYGVLPGLLGSIPILINWLVAERLGLVADEFSSRFFFGAGLLILVCGEFSDVWRDRNTRMEETYLYVTERLSRLTKRHLLLNLSHDRLEQEMLARPGSLRDALAKVRATVIAAGISKDPMPAAKELLQLLAQYVNIESATLHLLNTDGLDPTLDTQVAFIGEPASLEANDALLQIALEERNLAHIASGDVSMQRQTNQLVVAPLIAGNDRLVGVLAITRMPFFSLNVENLQMMSVILAYYADIVRTAPQVQQAQLALPTIPTMFAEELVRMQHMYEKVGISSHIVLLTFNGALSHEIPTEFLRIKRGLDLFWQTQVRGAPAIAILMPFASTSAKEGFLKRMEGWLESRFHGTLESLDIHVRVVDFANENPLAALQGVVGT